MNNRPMNNSLMKVHLEMDTVVPHGFMDVAGPKVIGELMEGAASGELPATLEIELASPDVTLGDVSPYMKRRWLDWLAADADQVKKARAALAAVEVDDDNCLAEPFLVWQQGTSFAEVEAWFR